METYTLREAAALTGTTLAAMRKKAERGQLRTVIRDGKRRVPRAELERLGLPVEPRPAATAEVVAELIARLEQQAAELASLRQLPARIDRQEQEHAQQLATEQALRVQAVQAADEQRQQLGLIASAGWRERRRIMRELRTA